MIKNSRQRVKQRRLVALEQVKARVKANGKAANTSEKERKGITPDKEKKRLARAKDELKTLEQRV
jgi:hypothetical protein